MPVLPAASISASTRSRADPCATGRVGRCHLLLAAAASPAAVPHGAEADEGAKPGGEGAAAVLVAGHLLQGGHEDLGGDVVHVGGKVAEQAIQDTVDEVAMPAV